MIKKQGGKDRCQIDQRKGERSHGQMIVRGALEANGIGHKSDAHHHGDKEVDEAAHAGQKRQQAHDQKKNCIKKNME